jgi:hypothetical protein
LLIMTKEQLRATVRRETGALAIAVIWLLVAQFACVLAWDQGFLTRQAALLHWLVVGVLPPALALWSMETSPVHG